MRLSLMKGTNNNKTPKEDKDGENMALGTKGKANKGPSQGQGSKGGEK